MSETRAKTAWRLEFDRAELPPEETSSTLAEAINRRFHTRGVTIFWDGVSICIPYAYSLSDSLDDLVETLVALIDDEGDHWFSFNWEGPGTLDADWHLQWRGDELTIDAEWRCALQTPVDELAERIVVSRKLFVRDWTRVLRYLLDSAAHLVGEQDDDGGDLEPCQRACAQLEEALKTL